jgi:hypothetical protein
MNEDADIWHAALAMLNRYRDEAMLEVAGRADDALDWGDVAATEVWHRIALPAGQRVALSLAVLYLCHWSFGSELLLP